MTPDEAEDIRAAIDVLVHPGVTLEMYRHGDTAFLDVMVDDHNGQTYLYSGAEFEGYQ